MSLAEKLAKQAFIHADGGTYPQNTLFNAISSVIQRPAWGTALVDCDGHGYQGIEIDEIARSPEFAAHKAALAARGKTRD